MLGQKIIQTFVDNDHLDRARRPTAIPTELSMRRVSRNLAELRLITVSEDVPVPCVPLRVCPRLSIHDRSSFKRLSERIRLTE